PAPLHRTRHPGALTRRSDSLSPVLRGVTIPTQLIDNRTPVERAVLVGAPLKSVDPRLSDEHIEELARLTDTAGGEVAGMLRQRIDSPHPRFFIGEGKAGELRDLVQATEADLVIFDEEL